MCNYTNTCPNVSFTLPETLLIFAANINFPFFINQFLPAAFGKSRSFGIASKSEALAQSKGKYLVTLIPGDGVGPELVHSVKRVFRYV